MTTVSHPHEANNDHGGELHVLTWNVGGLSPDRALELLCDLRSERIQPFYASFVICLQEVITETGKYTLEKQDIQLVFGKQESEWRGTGIAHTADLSHYQHKMLRCGSSAIVRHGNLRMTILSGHVPHHATTSECGDILATWDSQTARHRGKTVIGSDCNETFKPGANQEVLSESARGELLLTWWTAKGGTIPPQALDKHPYFPYNHQMHPRRLDYILTKDLATNNGTVLDLRHLATSDHEPIWVYCRTSLPPARPKKPPRPWGCRQPRDEDTVAKILGTWPHGSGDPLRQIAEIATAITKPGRGIRGFRESPELRLLRQTIVRMVPGAEQRRQWKEVLKLRRQEHSRWRTDMFDKAGWGFWHSKKTVDRDGHTSAWELRLQDDESWRQTLVKHFEGIFKRRPRAEVDRRFEAILEHLTIGCKYSPWQPFQDDELRAVRKRWKNGKSCGLDAISHEALKILLDDDYWRGKLRELFSDMLYVGKLQEAIERGITVLLAKGQEPTDWGETRPITLSSTLLKTYSQLIIHRAAHLVQEPARLQWSRRHRQGVELILMLRKVCRTSHDWGIPMYIAKLDIRKAFDSIYQEALAEQIAADVGGSGGRPWEARSWVTLLHAKEIRIFFRDETFVIGQTNGVRQGSPDSPIAFGRIVAKELDASIREASVVKDTTGDPPPEDGCCYMDDSYIWSSSRRHLQAMLDRLGENLPPRGLYIHPGKTDIIDNQAGGVEFKVGGNTVVSKGPKHVIAIHGR